MFGQFFDGKANVDTKSVATLDRLSSEISESRDHVRIMSQHSMSTAQMVNAILLQQQTLTSLIVPLLQNATPPGHQGVENQKPRAVNKPADAAPTMVEKKQISPNYSVDKYPASMSFKADSERAGVQQPNSTDDVARDEDLDNSMSIDSMIAPLRFGDKYASVQTGRKPVPLHEYQQTRQLKINRLQHLSDDKNLSVKERKRYRAQKYALQKRLSLKLKAHRKNRALNGTPHAPTLITMI